MQFHDYGFDLNTFLKDAVGTVNNILNPPATRTIGGGPAPTPTPVIVAPPAQPLATIAGIAITPMKLVVGLAAVGAVIYFARRKKRG